METTELILLGQYIKDLSFENPIAPSLPSQDKKSYSQFRCKYCLLGFKK